MSLTASIVILIVLLARFILKRAPKVFFYLLWAVVLFRLLCPVTLTSSISFLGFLDVPVTQTSTVDFVQTNIVHTEAPTTEVLVPDVSVGFHETPIQGKEQHAVDPLGTLMRVVMDTLIGDEAISQSANIGQEYFDAWKELAEARNAEHGHEYMKTNAPKAFLLL
jgi:hypothetical protein